MTALEFIMKHHQGQKDKIGEPYWKHPVWVSDNLPDWCSSEAKMAALLHDVLEDSDISVIDEFMSIEGITQKVIKMVLSLTRRDDETYFEYINRIKDSGDREIIVIKITDIFHNILPSRMTKLHIKVRKSLYNRYRKALTILMDEKN